ncbi:hypothetical protein C9374_005960 [Naegleria lovaniensis]|uniref:Solute-binding protein family 3/N-terminal domain-containing protein n=1 Tax=Naegleria lovaniensis TaxID=51637 RepID=A0AA88KMK9_NAELO|nr:uncharacterized protein C9374_005960 [Naegleria lovaniensis]KAG2381576.1 hypothetical protein C9374_005960 [Naegleria lovaniensis]
MTILTRTNTRIVSSTVSFLLAIVIVQLLFITHRFTSSHTHANPIASIEFNQAVDAAMYEVVSSSSFQQYITKIVGFPVPLCSTKIKYPTRWPVSSLITELKMCYDGSSYIAEPWPSVYKEVGRRMIEAFNAQYSLKLSAKFVPLVMNETLGYFESLRVAVESGECDVAVADTTLTEERSAKVKFSVCPYGVSVNAFLRSDLDNTTLTGITELKHLNRSGLNVTYYEGTIFDTIAQQELQAANRVPSTYEGQYTLVLQRKVHAVLGDVLDQQAWLEANRKDCVSCYIKAFGLGGSFGVFTQATTRSSEAVRHGIWPHSLMGVVVMGMLVLLMVEMFSKP